MKISQRQKDLLESLNQDQEKTDEIYRPGSYWSYKCKKAKNWIIKNGFTDFRGLHSPVATSFGDNLILDKRNEFGLNLKSQILKKITNLPILKQLYQNQVKLTKTHIESLVKYKSYFYQNDKRVKYLLDNYNLEDTALFDCVDKFSHKEILYSCLYLNILDLVDKINETIDLKNIVSVFEIGGGFGSNIHILLQNFKNIRKVIYLDVSPNIFVASEYLRYFYKDAVIDYLDHKDKEIIFSNNDKLEIFCIAPWQLPKIKSKIDYFHNANSFQEMTKNIIQNYSNYIKPLISSKGSISLGCYISKNPKIVQTDEILNFFGTDFKKFEFPAFYYNYQKNYNLFVNKK